MSLVVVTGASGYLGAHVIEQLLDAGYTVRGTARSGSAPRVLEKYASFGDRFQISVVDDIVTSDLTETFKGADALVHVASPLAGASTAEVVLKSARDGTVKVVEAAAKAGVKKIVVTASVVSLLNADQMTEPITVGEDGWNTMTYEDAIKPGVPGFVVYVAAKGLAERALWDFAREHPELDIATIHPPFLYGPTARGQVIDTPASGTNRMLYQLIAGEKGRALPDEIANPQFVNVKDAARAHVLALKAPASATPKRIVTSAGPLTYRASVEYLAKTRPELKDRLPVITGDEPPAQTYAIWDVSSAARIIGLKDYIGWEETLSSAVDDFLQKEKELAKSA